MSLTVRHFLVFVVEECLGQVKSVSGEENCQSVVDFRNEELQNSLLVRHVHVGKTETSAGVLRRAHKLTPVRPFRLTSFLTTV